MSILCETQHYEVSLRFTPTSSLITYQAQRECLLVSISRPILANSAFLSKRLYRCDRNQISTLLCRSRFVKRCRARLRYERPCSFFLPSRPQLLLMNAEPHLRRFQLHNYYSTVLKSQQQCRTSTPCPTPSSKMRETSWKPIPGLQGRYRRCEEPKYERSFPLKVGRNVLLLGGSKIRIE